MATHRLPILVWSVKPDTTGEAFFQPINSAITLTTSLARQLVLTLVNPAADAGVYGSFHVPQNYVGSPEIVVAGVLDGTPAASDIVAFGFGYRGFTNNEPIDSAAWVETVTFNSGDISSGGSNHADKDMLVFDSTGGTFTAGNLAAGDEVMYYCYRDYGVDTYGFDFHVTGIYFQYADA